MVWWPLLLFCLLLVFWWYSIWRRRTFWRRQILTELAVVDKDVDRGEIVKGWQQLAHLIRRITLKVSPAQMPVDRGGERWLSDLDGLFRTSEFSNGPGRGLIHYPYMREVDTNADELRALVEVVRNNVVRLKSVQ